MEKIAETLLNKIGGRKFVLSVVVFALSTLLVSISKLDPNDYFSVVRTLIIAYPAGNIIQNAFIKKAADIKAELIETAIESFSGGDALDTMGGRKFLYVIGIYATAVALFSFKVLDSTVFIEITNWLVSVYIAANVGGKALTNGVTITLGKKEEPE